MMSVGGGRMKKMSERLITDCAVDMILYRDYSN